MKVSESNCSLRLTAGGLLFFIPILLLTNTPLKTKRMERLFDNEDTNIFGPPPVAGVYAVCVRHNDRKHKERIVYIGSSKNVSKRLKNQSHPYLLCFHRFPRMLVYTKTIETEDFMELEKELIRVYKPLLNRQHKKNG